MCLRGAFVQSGKKFKDLRPLFMGEIDPRRSRRGPLAIPTEIRLQIMMLRDKIKRGNFVRQEPRLQVG
jgi:hypothetical protein